MGISQILLEISNLAVSKDYSIGNKRLTTRIRVVGEARSAQADRTSFVLYDRRRWPRGRGLGSGRNEVPGAMLLINQE